MFQMLINRVIAIFPAVELHVTEVAFAIVFGVGFGFVEETGACELDCICSVGCRNVIMFSKYSHRLVEDSCAAKRSWYSSSSWYSRHVSLAGASRLQRCRDDLVSYCSSPQRPLCPSLAAVLLISCCYVSNVRVMCSCKVAEVVFTRSKHSS